MLPSRHGSPQVRGSVRTIVLFCSMLEVLGRFVPIYIMSGGRVSTARRATWVHASCVRIARRLSLVPSVIAAAGPGGSGLTVSNHLTYLDILVYGAAGPFLFVAKSEIRRWPLLGTLARCGGTIFVDRGRSLQVAQASRQIERALLDGIPVLLFPEGTSSDGSSVLPFRPPLFDPAIRAGAGITAAAIRYHADDAAEDQLTYWGDMIFVPHLFRTLCIRGLDAQVRFDSPYHFSDRKTAARVAWRQVQALRQQSAPQGQPAPLLEYTS
jgi:1-acyl-sn-glycerol-3-phosphate acyltransferase